MDNITSDLSSKGVRGEKDDTILLIKMILEQLKVETILDLGCGDGDYHKYFEGRKFIGLDERLSFKNNGNIYHNVNLNNIPYECLIDKHKCVMALDIIDHLFRPDLFIENIYDNLLEDDGILILSVLNSESIDEKISKVNLSLFDDRIKEVSNGRWTAQHIRFFDAESISYIMGEIGFKDINIFGCNCYTSLVGKSICDEFNKSFNIPIEYINRKLGQVFGILSPTLLCIGKK